ncbi:hypothetical protein Rsub_07981 [Raphidocelis subcapitata]|uniref:alanine--glyoxylate transaminase n=1 Tax=Raphidocelis subcapitata TaxID=307507 RepID=A0A2V0P5G7_9CHLO|nr:hypothetical protein Rsub_07981 [Raphidocelis subcapitata]|eukprot:GBF94809.1 hypothetical protein Rsub_07981 [Raphidocelis subcapitata]
MSARRGISALQLFARRYATHAGRAGETVPPTSNAHRHALDPSGVIEVPQRLLMGPGPANAHPRILAAQSLPLLGHMHPPFLKIMDEISEGLRYCLQTDSKYTLMVSGTGHAGMEAAIANLLEPGEKIIVGNKGIWGQRVADLAARYGGDVVELKAEAGRSFSLAEMTAALEKHRPAVLFLCQGESSTGVHQSLAGLGEVCKRTGTLLLVDTVCSLGGVPFYFDEWGVDCMYSGSQKCLSAPPGGAPFAMSARAMEKLKGRKTKPATYNLDMNLIGDYWGCLITVNTIKVPAGVDWAAVVKNAMDRYSLEIAGGLGPTAGKVWRVGLMGYNARPQNVALVVEAFRDGLAKQGKL